MDNRPIGIFDSGTGGLTSVRRLTRVAPQESLVYFGDTIRAPYGGRDPEELRFFSRRNARFLRAQGVKAVIVSCNTSTANAMEQLEADNADIPIVGAIAPAAEAAALSSVSGRIGVMATEATIRSGLYEKTILAQRPGARVISRSCPKLVPLIEAGRTSKDDPALRAALAEDLAPLAEARVDTIVLGCTHYPLVEDAILDVLGYRAVTVDSGAACVGSVLEALRARDGLADPYAERTERYYCSGRKNDFLTVARGFLGRSIDGCTEEIDVTDY